jgi:hypothetical protein|tara:strand:+ start:1645 stop:1815 length:171 start_codon:yes stop_codon:yes gene_type:complete
MTKTSIFKGSVSQKEVDWIKKRLPKNNSSLSNISGSISNKELKFLKKNIPNTKRYK